jgi:hypothetical protein
VRDAIIQVKQGAKNVLVFSLVSRELLESGRSRRHCANLGGERSIFSSKDEPERGGGGGWELSLLSDDF